MVKRGTIKKRKDGRYEAQYTVNGTRKSVYGRTPEEANTKLTQVLYEMDSGAYTDSTLTVGRWLDLWLAEYVKGHVKQKTYQFYECNVRCHLRPAFQNIKLKELKADKVQRLFNEKTKAGLSTNSVSGIKRTLHCALNVAITNGLLIRNVAHGVKVQSVKGKEKRILTLQEQEALLQALKGEDKGFMVELALFTGLRCGEILGLRWEDVDTKAKTITIRQTVQRLKGEDGKTSLVFGTPKSSKGSRTIPLLGKVADKLKKHYSKQLKERVRVGEEKWDDHDLVFSNWGKPIDPSNFQRFLSAMSEKAKIERVNIHALRHAFASRAREQGLELEVLSNILGHSDIRLTANTYTHVSLERTENEMKKMESLL